MNGPANTDLKPIKEKEQDDKEEIITPPQNPLVPPFRNPLAF